MLDRQLHKITANQTNTLIICDKFCTNETHLCNNQHENELSLISPTNLNEPFCYIATKLLHEKCRHIAYVLNDC